MGIGGYIKEQRRLKKIETDEYYKEKERLRKIKVSKQCFKTKSKEEQARERGRQKAKTPLGIGFTIKDVGRKAGNVGVRSQNISNALANNFFGYGSKQVKRSRRARR